MHPFLGLTLFCAFVAIRAAIIVNKKEEVKKAAISK